MRCSQRNHSTNDQRGTIQLSRNRYRFVHPNYQNRGIGTMLLQKMLLTLENRRVPSFCLDSGYKQAQMIWQKKFGQPDFVLENYWGANSHHMIWKRTLPFQI